MATTDTPNFQPGYGGHGRGILASHPAAQEEPDQLALVTCIEACADCAQACAACADACLGEKNVAELVTCIRLNQDCADLCEATGDILTRQLSLDWDIAGAALEACAIACEKCATECARHGEHMMHCRLCEAACRSCQQACEYLLGETDRISA